MLNNLYKTKAYLVGAIQYTNGRAWRDEIIEKLNPLGIVCYNPYHKPFVKDIDESEHLQADLQSLLKGEKFDEVAKRVKVIRCYDLALVDKADFIIAYIDPKIFTVGSWEEIFWANRIKRPIFLIIEGGKQACPLWIYGTIPHKYIYNNLDEVVNILTKIDSGEKEIDSDRWRLLKEEFR
jgi:hypothetical protein